MNNNTGPLNFVHPSVIVMLHKPRISMVGAAAYKNTPFH